VVWCYSTSRGVFGGILLMWDRRVVKKVYEDSIGTGSGRRFDCYFSGVC
jgi:hypothetical protein